MQFQFCKNLITEISIRYGRPEREAVTETEPNKKKEDCSFLARTQPVKSHDSMGFPGGGIGKGKTNKKTCLPMQEM